MIAVGDEGTHGKTKKSGATSSGDSLNHRVATDVATDVVSGTVGSFVTHGYHLLPLRGIRPLRGFIEVFFCEGSDMQFCNLQNIRYF